MSDELNRLERRTNTIEGAIIKIEQVLEVTLVHQAKSISDNQDDIKILKKHDEEFTNAVYQSCDAKTKEIDMKIEKAVGKVYKYLGGSLVGLFGLFLSAVVYFNNQDGEIYNKFNREIANIHIVISDKHEDVIENGTNIKTIINTLDKINDKIDDLKAVK